MDVRQSISVEDFQHIVEGSLSRREGSDLAVQRNNVPVKHMKRRKVCRYCARKHNLSTQISSEEAIKHFILAYFSNCIIRHATGRGELDIREEAKYGKDLISPRMDYNDHEDWLNGVLLKRFLSRQFPMQLQLRSVAVVHD
ncbi:hypothetical protein QR680_003728 [Steinernema hermaphroditum]|uniref:Uncharacterized protein n=1 Tax=Steinernema hermaphroditum TaxID=289476 RepID=A0AA39LSS0_9BILA|nr:hypothetical protein QR680_003728 [Steinernema hermaphroditum]